MAPAWASRAAATPPPAPDPITTTSQTPCTAPPQAFTSCAESTWLTFKTTLDGRNSTVFRTSVKMDPTRRSFRAHVYRIHWGALLSAPLLAYVASWQVPAASLRGRCSHSGQWLQHTASAQTCACPRKGVQVSVHQVLRRQTRAAQAQPEKPSHMKAMRGL